jgi:diacylglycerol kinase family enzyme
VRGLLIVNPQATTTTGNSADLAIRSLAGLVDLDVEHTRYRGHAHELAATARGELVIVLGGDGAINEAVNGIMGRPAETAGQGTAGQGTAGEGTPPLLAVIPGGGGNVFAQALGLPLDAVAAIAKIKEVLEAGRYRTIGLGLAGDRYFTFSAGLGMDAEVVREVERLRASGRRETAALFAWAILRQYASGTDRRTPALTLERDGQPATPDLFMTAITNSSPWTYVHGRAVLPVPDPDFNSGLDVLALRKLRATTILSAVGQMLLIRSRSPRGRHVLTVTGQQALTVRSVRPIAFQVDGDYLGETEAVKFHFVPHALRVVALPPAAPRAKCDRSDIKLSRTAAVASCACQGMLKGLTRCLARGRLARAISPDGPGFDDTASPSGARPGRRGLGGFLLGIITVPGNLDRLTVR